MIVYTFLLDTKCSQGIRQKVEINNSGNAVIVGQTASVNFPVTPDAYDGSYNYDPLKGYLLDAFLAEISGVRPPGTADILVTNTDAPDPVDVGSELTWTMKAINTGPEDAPNISILDRLPLVDADDDGFPETVSVKLLGIWVDGVEVLSCNDCNESCDICYSLTKDDPGIKDNYIVQFNIGSINASVMRTIIIVAMPLASGELLNHIEVCAGIFDADFVCQSTLDVNPANNIATARTQSQSGSSLEVE